MKKTTFVCKAHDLEDAHFGIEDILSENGGEHQDLYYIASAIELPRSMWNDLVSDFLTDHDYIAEFSKRGFKVLNGAVPCLQVTTNCSDIVILIDPQGYDYARYVAIKHT